MIIGGELLVYFWQEMTGKKGKEEGARIGIVQWRLERKKMKITSILGSIEETCHGPIEGAFVPLFLLSLSLLFVTSFLYFAEYSYLFHLV